MWLLLLLYIKTHTKKYINLVNSRTISDVPKKKKKKELNDQRLSRQCVNFFFVCVLLRVIKNYVRFFVSDYYVAVSLTTFQSLKNAKKKRKNQFPVYVSPCVFEPFVNEIYNNKTTKSFHAPLHSIFTPKFVSRNTFPFFFFAKHLLRAPDGERITRANCLYCLSNTPMDERGKKRKKKMNTNKQAKKNMKLRVIDNLMLYFVHMWTSALV